MKCKVLIPFDYAYDGVHANRLKIGRSYPFRDEHVANLEAEGKIERAARAVAADAPKRRRKPKGE